ncbi:S1 RNA-binding domain-containing protein [Candidatus Peribacteria bacterium]|jgi:small subunit ribosomal protein S1|nr:S1 RNA-binding domain-containing protein [Candidatus Peribacteria bacterium]MBT4021469.1 S1 RNA-binding domain-containing protein [Candidatus Peribacteria bacterium]MBT4240379.1 S1 RNA-binding domain-containing protein [Candidatus Peribacteria bacterium]MBT4473802.1 S1 RNA-binding domain-containing protein [Candidatus Peribacteria bacterium]
MSQKILNKENEKMEKLLSEESAPPVISPKPGEVLDGEVVFKGKNKLLLDISGSATGIISGRELRDSFHTFQELSVGAEVTAMVLEEENDEGMIVMSLRRVSQQKAWDKFYKLIDDDGTMSFVPQEANKGGLLANIDGIRTFLPVSQLSPVNYPRVTDKSEIMNRLGKFIGQEFFVKIIMTDEDAGKIVVSEREAMSEHRAKSLEGLKTGDEREGAVSGIVNFGIFVTFDGLEGLVHISEIAWGHVKNPSEFVRVGDRVKVKVIGMEGEKLSLSIKQLTKDPWEAVAERYPVGKRVQGTITRLTDYGAFVKLENEINGLVHLSEITHAKIADASDVLKIGQKIDVQVINIEPDERRIGLSVKALLPIDKKMLEEMKKEEEASKSSKKKSETAKDSDDSKGSGGFVASKTGKKYYPADSAAAKRIKEENRVEFVSEKEAEKAGYAA